MRKPYYCIFRRELRGQCGFLRRNPRISALPASKQSFSLQLLFTVTLKHAYLACSNCKVLVAWSQTSVGPKYWIGPGYT